MLTTCHVLTVSFHLKNRCFFIMCIDGRNINKLNKNVVCLFLNIYLLYILTYLVHISSVNKL